MKTTTLGDWIYLTGNDWDVIYDAAYDELEMKATDEQLEELWESFPKCLKTDILHWGAGDTVVREKIHKHLRQ